MKKRLLHCTQCNQTYEIDQVHYRCGVCGEPLELETVTDGRIDEGNALHQNILQRYADFFPFSSIELKASLGEGFTALVDSGMVSEQIGIGGLHFKNESQNPTWSFKDRGTYVGLQHALKLGYKRIGTVSTGNMAPSVAAYASKVGLESFIFVNEGIAEEKMNPISIYSPHLIRVIGDYSKTYFESLKIGRENDIYFLNSDSPFRVEGSKTIAFEICEQLDFQMPDYVVVPTSAGGNIRGIEKGFREFMLSGIIDRIPKMICVQASGCAPIVKAFEAGKRVVERFENPETIAHGIGNPFPPSGNQVLRMLERNGGMAVSVTDEEIIASQKRLAEMGLFVQPASAVSLAAVMKLREANRVDKEARIVCVLTGSGLKYTAAFKKHRLRSDRCNLEELSEFIKNNLQG